MGRRARGGAHPLPAATALRDLLIEHEEVSVLAGAFHYHLDTSSVDAVADRRSTPGSGLSRGLTMVTGTLRR